MACAAPGAAARPTAPSPPGHLPPAAAQTGVDSLGHPYIVTVGRVAGDGESYDVCKELFDPIVEDRPSGHKPSDEHKAGGPRHLAQ